MYAVKIDPENPDKEIISKAADVIKKGGLVVFPTETVYGIAANLFDEGAIAKLRRVKQRPEDKHFTVHISDIGMIEDMGCDITKEARSLMSKYWPGPLTIILRSRSGDKTGFRMPANKIALGLIRSSGVPVVAPSANISGDKAPVSAAEVSKDLSEKVDMILDGGRTEIGIESTVVDMTVKPAKVLREGAIKITELSKILNG